TPPRLWASGRGAYLAPPRTGEADQPKARGGVPRLHARYARPPPPDYVRSPSPSRGGARGRSSPASCATPQAAPPAAETPAPRKRGRKTPPPPRPQPLQQTPPIDSARWSPQAAPPLAPPPQPPDKPAAERNGTRSPPPTRSGPPPPRPEAH